MYIHISIREKVQICFLIKNKRNHPVNAEYMHSFIPTPANHPLCKRERAAGPWRWFTKPIIYWEMMENSLWFGSYILAFAKALENHSHLTITGSRMMLFLKSGGIAKSSVHLQMCLSHSRNTVYLNVWSPVKLHTEKLHWRNAGNVVPIDIHSYNFYFLPWSSFILIRSKIPFISLEDCFTSLPLKKNRSSGNLIFSRLTMYKRLCIHQLQFSTQVSSVLFTPEPK